MKTITTLLAAALITSSQITFAGDCRSAEINRLIADMGPAGSLAVCPEWEHARHEWNARRDVPPIPVPRTEYRTRIKSNQRR